MERRLFPRAKVVLPVEGDLLGQRLNLEIVDLSENGIKLLSKQELPKNFFLYLDLPPCYSKDPLKARGIRIKARTLWDCNISSRKGWHYGCCFSTIEETDRQILKDLIRYELEKSVSKKVLYEKPKLKIKRQQHSCNMYAGDMTIGCEHECLYCHFSKLNEEEWKEKYSSATDFPVSVDISSIYEMKEFPKSVVYLSPSSDPFGIYAKDLTYEFLSFMLPKGVRFAISTKNIIPNKSILLIKQYISQIEIEIGIMNLSEKRNNILEKGCPSVEARLGNLSTLVKEGLNPGVRMDPIFPIIDDKQESLEKTIKAVSGVGVKYITGAYVFTFGRFLKNMRNNPFIKESVSYLNEKCYVAGGKAFSVSLERKKKTFELIYEICKKYGIIFSACGCKEIRLRDTKYSLICRRSIKTSD